MIVILSFALGVGLTMRPLRDIDDGGIVNDGIPFLFEGVAWKIASGALCFSLSLLSLFFERKP